MNRSSSTFALPLQSVLQVVQVMYHRAIRSSWFVQYAARGTLETLPCSTALGYHFAQCKNNRHAPSPRSRAA